MIDMTTMRTADLPLSAIRHDAGYQRLLNAQRVDEIARDWNPKLALELIVSERPDGTFYLLDGQHRVEAMRRRGIGSWRCLIYVGLTPDQEADLFVELQQKRRSLSAIDLYRAGLKGNDEIAKAIDEIVRRHGFHVARGGGSTGAITSVDAMRGVITRYGPRILDVTLKTIRLLWPTEPIAYGSAGIQGIGLFFAAMERAPGFEYESFVQRLQSVAFGEIVREAKGRRLTGATVVETGNSLALFVATVLFDRYNRRRRTGSLPAFAKLIPNRKADPVFAETVAAVQGIIDAGAYATVASIAGALRISESSARSRITRAIDRGLLVDGPPVRIGASAIRTYEVAR
jgi:hypothetical protein